MQRALGHEVHRYTVTICVPIKHIWYTTHAVEATSAKHAVRMLKQKIAAMSQEEFEKEFCQYMSGPMYHGEWTRKQPDDKTQVRFSAYPSKYCSNPACGGVLRASCKAKDCYDSRGDTGGVANNSYTGPPTGGEDWKDIDE